ncbi:hypothetical protein R7V41_00995 [Mesomycoplasma ovipneumoniae]|uniref:Uncharacterized protein n=1 Tax=Mesomycoplasma ovipneumoniae TaxID=29562 RepID=A0AAJ2P9D3_9BACT|nr:hypothetical protein [Mesomycoplasma ovipneumoniae]MDW2906298.1 hypothetical protein [Mesomycoplasma ovipneumoniae]MDW2914095.1 hypothetical protein [Mesomycoplasma ovipneumoniae]
MDFESYKRTAEPKIKQIKKVSKIFLALFLAFFLVFIGLLTYYIVQLNSDEGFRTEFVEATWLAIALLSAVIAIVFLVSFFIGIYKIKAMKKVEKNIETQLKEL